MTDTPRATTADDTNNANNPNNATDTAIAAAVFRRLLRHLDEHKEVQNIDLMNLAAFCRNCLAKWYVAAAAEQGRTLSYEEAREIIYGMPYSQWKDLYQTDATPAQLAKFGAGREQT